MHVAWFVWLCGTPKKSTFGDIYHIKTKVYLGKEGLVAMV